MNKTLFVVGAKILLTAGRFSGQRGKIVASFPAVSEAIVKIDGPNTTLKVAFDDLIWVDYPKIKI